MKNNKLGIFYHLNEKPENRQYWIGTFTKDKTSCESVVKGINGNGKKSLLMAIQYLQNEKK